MSGKEGKETTVGMFHRIKQLIKRILPEKSSWVWKLVLPTIP